jgi:hypothetical protein
MAAEMNAITRGESHTLLRQEERLRRHLGERFAVRTRFEPMTDVRAMLVSPPTEDGEKSLIIASDAGAAERIYLYVHVVAHMALRHHVPLVTIVEGPPGVTRLGADSREHLEAERVARAMWWAPEAADLGAPSLVRGSALLRSLVSRAPTRAALRSLLLAMRAAYYDLRIERALASTRLAAWLRDAFCVTAVVSAAPQLSK